MTELGIAARCFEGKGEWDRATEVREEMLGHEAQYNHKFGIEHSLEFIAKDWYQQRKALEEQGKKQEALASYKKVIATLDRALFYHVNPQVGLTERS